MGDAERIGYERRLRVAVLAGDESAWREWYDACADRLRQYVRWRCGGRADLADDVLQEAWLTAVRKIKSFDPVAGPFQGWVTGVAINVLRNHLRSHQRTVIRRRELTGGETAPAADDDRTLRTATALASLQTRHELVLRAKYLDGRTVNDIAIDWGESPKAVESLLTRARDAFRMAYDTDG